MNWFEIHALLSVSFRFEAFSGQQAERILRAYLLPIQGLDRLIESEGVRYLCIPKCSAIGARETVLEGLVHKQSQVVLMSIPPGGDIGREVHELVDQVLVFVKDKGRAELGGETHDINPGDMFAVPTV